MPSEIKPKVRKVADIKAKLLNPALTSHFEVQIPLPNGAVRAELESIRPDGGEQQDALNIRCTNASLPGSNLATLEFKRSKSFPQFTKVILLRRILKSERGEVYAKIY